MAISTELLELLRQLINDESATVFTDDELEQILDACDEDINRAAAWCALIRANKVAENAPETPSAWPTLPDPPTAPTLPDPPAWPTLESEPSDIETMLANARDSTGLLTTLDALGGQVEISELMSNYRAQAEIYLRVWQQKRDDQVKEYQASYEQWVQRCDHLLRQWEQDVQIWVKRCQNLIDESSHDESTNSRKDSSALRAAETWISEGREWKG